MRTFLIFLFLLAPPGAAFAQSEDPPAPPAPAPAAGPSGERVVLPAKRLYAQAMLEIDLSSTFAFDPFSLAPDVFYGATPDLTVALTHSRVASTGIIGDTGSSLCLVGDRCPDVYRGFGLDGRYHLKAGTVSAAGNFGLYVNSIDPFQLAIKLGVIGRYRPKPDSKLAVDFAPSLFIGVTEREPAAMGAPGNKETLVLPGTVSYLVMPRLVAMVQTGLVLPFLDVGQLFYVPLTIGASYEVNKQITATAAFSIQHLLGGDGIQNGFDARSFIIGGGYAF